MIRTISLGIAGCVAAAGLSLSVASPAVAQPAGSYTRTCTGVVKRGPYLEAFCLNVAGRYVDTRIDLRDCDGAISNDNGRLSCPAGSSRRADNRNDRAASDDDRHGRSGERGRRYDDHADDEQGGIYGRRGYNSDRSSNYGRSYGSDRDYRYGDRRAYERDRLGERYDYGTRYDSRRYYDDEDYRRR